MPVFEKEQMEKLYGQILVSAKAPRKDEEDMNILSWDIWKDYFLE